MIQAGASCSGTPDGVCLVWISWLRNHLDVNRVYGTDLMGWGVIACAADIFTPAVCQNLLLPDMTVSESRSLSFGPGCPF